MVCRVLNGMDEVDKDQMMWDTRESRGHGGKMRGGLCKRHKEEQPPQKDIVLA